MFGQPASIFINVWSIRLTGLVLWFGCPPDPSEAPSGIDPQGAGTRSPGAGGQEADSKAEASKEATSKEEASKVADSKEEA